MTTVGDDSCRLFRYSVTTSVVSRGVEKFLENYSRSPDADFNAILCFTDRAEEIERELGEPV